VSTSAPYPLKLDFNADRRITGWRPLVQWLLAIPHLMIAWALRSLRQVLILAGVAELNHGGRSTERGGQAPTRGLRRPTRQISRRARSWRRPRHCRRRDTRPLGSAPRR